MEWLDNGLALSLVVFIPAAAALLIAVTPRKNEAVIKWIALIATLASFALAVVLAVNFDYSNGQEYQFGTNKAWIDVINARYIIGVDGISLPLVLLSTLIALASVVYTWNHWPEPHTPKTFMALTMILAVGMTGTFVALDLVLFFVFFEVVLLPMYFMIGIWGDRFKRRVPILNWSIEQRLYASIKFFLFTLFGSAFMLLGFLALFFRSGDFTPNGQDTFSIPVLSQLGSEGAFAGTFAFWVFLALFLGFAVKVPMWPLHTWLPDAHTAAPTVGSVILAAILLKLGTYGFVRISLPILPDEAENWAWFIGVLAVIGIIYGALACLAQEDMKRLIAYSSVGHMGFVMLGIATLTTIGINAALIGMVAHGIITGLLFFLAGSMSHRYHTRDMARLGGNLKLMPIMGVIFGLAAMASLGLPSLAGFWGEFMSMMGSFNPLPGLSVTLFRTFMVIAAIGTVLTAGYMLWMLRRVNLGEPTGEFAGRSFRDVDAFEWLSWAPLIVAIFVIGFWPNVVFAFTNDAVINLVAQSFGGG